MLTSLGSGKNPDFGILRWVKHASYSGRNQLACGSHRCDSSRVLTSLGSGKNPDFGILQWVKHASYSGRNQAGVWFPQVRLRADGTVDELLTLQANLASNPCPRPGYRARPTVTTHAHIAGDVSFALWPLADAARGDCTRQLYKELALTRQRTQAANGFELISNATAVRRSAFPSFRLA